MSEVVAKKKKKESTQSSVGDEVEDEVEGNVFEKTYHIGLGTYEHALYGYDCACVVQQDDRDGDKEDDEHVATGPLMLLEATLKKAYLFEAHSASVTCVASSGRFLASGSSDEQIKIYDVKRKVEEGLLMLHQGTITAMAFHKQAILITAGEDGIICLWDTSDWTNLKTLKGHKGGVTSFSIHPSGKLALSLGKDSTLRVWNLVTGRCAYTTTRKKVGDIVAWSPDGNKYVVVSDKCIEVLSMETNELLTVFNSEHHITSCAFISPSLLAFGGYSKTLFVVDVDTSDAVASFSAHERRITCMATAPASDDSLSSPILVTADSDGIVKMWSVDDLLGATDDDAAVPVAATQTESRVTCITITDPNEKVVKATTALKRAKRTHAQAIWNSKVASAAEHQQQGKHAKRGKKSQQHQDAQQRQQRTKATKQTKLSQSQKEKEAQSVVEAMSVLKGNTPKGKGKKPRNMNSSRVNKGKGKGKQRKAGNNK